MKSNMNMFSSLKLSPRLAVLIAKNTEVFEAQSKLRITFFTALFLFTFTISLSVWVVGALLIARGLKKMVTSVKEVEGIMSKIGPTTRKSITTSIDTSEWEEFLGDSHSQDFLGMYSIGANY
jgi:hypothetical protein